MSDYDKDELSRLILEQNITYSEIGKMHGVSGNAIKKAAQKLGIPLPRRRKVNESENFSHSGYRKDSLVNQIADEKFISIIKESIKWVEIGEKLGYKTALSSNVKQSIEKRCSMLGMELNFVELIDITNLTKNELFEKRKNWQSARSAIQKHARKIYFNSHSSPKCVVCKYTNHVEVAHIKAVSNFGGDTTIEEINLLTNLIGLCPNHHWEFDNKLLKI